MYQGFYGLSQIKTLISLITILILIAALVVFLTYQYRLKQPLFSLINATLIFLFIIQIGVSFRASGLSNSRYSEVLWAGNIIDKEIILSQIESKRQTREFTSDGIKIGLINAQEPSILWELRDYDVKSFKKVLNPNEEFDILISQTDFIEGTAEKYYGQEFFISSNPKWSIEPIRSFWLYDYWSWLALRKSQMYKSYNYIWVKA